MRFSLGDDVAMADNEVGGHRAQLFVLGDGESDSCCAVCVSALADEVANRHNLAHVRVELLEPLVRGRPTD